MCVSEILSVREVKLPVNLSVIAADLSCSACPGFTVSLSCSSLSYIQRPMKTSNCCSFSATLELHYQSHGNCCRMVEAKRKDKDLT